MAPARKTLTRLGRKRRPETVQILMPSRRSAVGPTVERILRTVRRAHLSQEQQDNLAVAAAEALSNAALHGNGLRSGLLVSIRIKVRSNGDTLVQVRDSGTGFDPKGLRDPTDPSYLLLPGGRGIYMMQRLVDEVSFNKAGNIVSLKVKAPRSKTTRGKPSVPGRPRAVGAAKSTKRR
jgi:anti-sigma regulatory factor (Ser/Thr protein kinase)